MVVVSHPLVLVSRNSHSDCLEFQIGQGSNFDYFWPLKMVIIVLRNIGMEKT